MSGKLILGIDLQEGFLIDEARKLGYVERVSKFLSQQNKKEVLLTKFINQPNNNFEKLLGYTDLQPGDPGLKLIGDLEQQGFDVMEKSTYSAWQPTLAARVKEQGITEIIMFGLDSEACVLKTALDVFEAGLKPTVLKDLCFSSNGSSGHDMGIQLLETLIGKQRVQ